MLARLSLVFMMVWLASCASSKNHLINKNNHIRQDIDPAISAKAAGSSGISLLDHQLVPIDYMHKNPDIKGILVNHYMGTGKTYLGIGFAESYADHPVIILAPKFLQSHWQNQLKEYGVKNPGRYSFVSYDDAPAKLAHLDVAKHILLADEVHNLVKRMRSLDRDENARYTEVYANLRNSYKILGLTGTPIYNDESDIAFILNFVSGQNLMPFNQEEFRLKYNKILTGRQFFRGYLTESNLMVTLAPITLGFFMSAIFPPPFGILIGMPLGIFTPVLVNSFLDPTTYKFRELDVPKMQPLMSRFISYYRFDESKFEDYPALDFKVMQVSYNRPQYSFFLRLVEGDLPVPELQRLLKNEKTKRSDEFVNINSTSLHEQIYSSIGAGRDIGNFEFNSKDQSVIEPPKFLKILDQIKKDNDQTVIYSNYYDTGILAFESFLKRQGYEQKYGIIEPSMSVEEVSQIVQKYNSEEIKLLMLHPDITEGISLKGTQNLHILEPMLNSTVLEQVIGRTRRFQSHSHLPKDKQLVKVKMWQSTSSSWDSDMGDIKRANWYKRYRELAYMSRWGLGLWQVDKKIDKKALNPEELALLKLETLKNNLLEIQSKLKEQSIEYLYSN